jgi:hypothetical protein
MIQKFYQGTPTIDKYRQQSGWIQNYPPKKISSLPIYKWHIWTEKEIREATPFTITSTNIKYLGVTLTKQVKDLYNENFKSLKTKIEEEIRRWRDL